MVNPRRRAFWYVWTNNIRRRMVIGVVLTCYRLGESGPIVRQYAPLDDSRAIYRARLCRLIYFCRPFAQFL